MGDRGRCGKPIRVTERLHCFSGPLRWRCGVMKFTSNETVRSFWGHDANVKDYVAIARLDHATKHVFILPGVVLAYLLKGVHSPNVTWSIFAGLLAAVSIASANYVINEYLDREFDRHHPAKSKRAAVQRELRPGLIVAEWAMLATIGLAAASSVSSVMLFVAIVFAAQGVVYNVRPLRSKDIPYFDVISESINNPLRLMIGWAMIDPWTLPPGSIILAYWCGGAFLMSAKRLSEYREIVATYGKDTLVRYRRSFAGYTEVSLTVSTFVWSLFSVAMLAIFLIKYRIEYVILLPVVSLLFGQYLSMSMLPNSTAQKPENLFAERGLMVTTASLSALFLLLSLVDLPILEPLTSQKYISFD
jgi:4-hydroxybenzoate polyprenyltransferase